MRKLAFDNLQDEVREVLRDEIRETITTHVRDNVLGASEVMTGMLPKALAALEQDLDSRDEIVRARAYSLLLKYVMPLGKEEGKDLDLGRLTVIHEIPVPDTPLGEAFIDAVEDQEPMALDPGVEAFEAGWPKCHYCHAHKHPDAMHEETGGPGKGTRFCCTSCRITRQYKRGKADPLAMLKDPLVS